LSGRSAPQNGSAPPDGVTQRAVGIYRRFRQIIHEGAKFAIVGLTGILITDLLFIPLRGNLGPLTSITVATAIATVVTFLGNRYWSFRDREGGSTGRETVMFFIMNGIGLLIQYAVLGFSDYGLGLTSKTDNFIAVNLGIGFGTLFRFWSYRKWVWVPPEVNLARLRRGRHRQGRDLSTIPPPLQRAPAVAPILPPLATAPAAVQVRPGSLPPQIPTGESESQTLQTPRAG
jgi:putative flippase GtrA